MDSYAWFITSAGSAFLGTLSGSVQISGARDKKVTVARARATLRPTKGAGAFSFH